MKFQEEKTINFFDIFLKAKAALKKNWTLALAPCLMIIWFSVIFALLCPDYFQADSLIVIQEQRINEDVVKVGKQDDTKDRMEQLLQTVLSRPRLRKIVRRFQLYPELVAGADVEKAATKLRKAVVIAPPESASGYQGMKSFRMSFGYRDPDIAYQVTKALTDLFIEESVLDTRQQINTEKDFLEGQLEEARKQLEATENSVQKFVQENFGQLPDDLNAAIARLESAQNQLASNNELISSNSQRKEHLLKELRDVRSSPIPVVSSGDNPLADPQDSLIQLEQALVVLSSKYSEKHPDVIRTKQRIAALREQLKAQGTSGAPKTSVSSSALGANRAQGRDIERQINELDVAMNAMQAENKRLKEKIEELEGAIKNMPVKQQELVKIRRDYENKKLYYDKLLKGKKELDLRADMVRTQQDSQFKVIEPPEKPFRPVWPNRFLFVAVGLLGGVAMFLLIAVGKVFLHPSFKRKDEVEAELDLKVIGVIPPLETVFKKTQNRKIAATSLIVSAIVLIVGTVLMLLLVEGGMSRIHGLLEALRNIVIPSAKGIGSWGL